MVQSCLRGCDVAEIKRPDAFFVCLSGKMADPSVAA